jgi:sulfur-carrier protein adenylyltransferase/sulfurtransferase
MLTPSELHRYSRQILLPGFDTEGQEKLKRSSVLVIGAGGLGSPTLLYLTAAGIGRIGIVDFDLVDQSNLQRQVLFKTNDIGKNKAMTAAIRLKELNPLVNLEVHPTLLNSTNAMEIISKYDLVVDGSDNLPTRYLVNDACVFLKKTLIYGAIFQYEGQASVFNQLLSDGSRGPNYRDLFPQPPPPEMVPSCSEGGVLGVLPGIIGCIQANETIKVLCGLGTTLSGRLLIFDSLDFTTRILNVRKNPANPVSGDSPSIFGLIDYEAFCNPSLHRDSDVVQEILPMELRSWMDQGKLFQLIDVRDLKEVEFVNLKGIHIPLKSLAQELHQINKDIPVVIHCKTGGRSLTATKKLQSEFGFTNVINLKGGIIKWIEDVDPSLPKY